MPVYTLIPDEHDFDTEEIAASDAAGLLSAIHGYGWNAARVLQDGEYLFTVALNRDGVWSILPGLPEREAAPGARSNLRLP